MLVERWRVRCNRVRPGGALGYQPPAPETIMPVRCTNARRLPCPAAQTDLTN